MVKKNKNNNIRVNATCYVAFNVKPLYRPLIICYLVIYVYISAVFVVYIFASVIAFLMLVLVLVLVMFMSKYYEHFNVTKEIVLAY